MSKRVQDLIRRKNEETQETEIARSTSFHLSNETSASQPPNTTRRKEPPPPRTSVRIRTDLAKKCKRAAVDIDTTIAELIEAFIEDGLAVLEEEKKQSS